MDNSRHTDPFKEAIRKKLTTGPVFADSDNRLWEKVFAEIKPERKVVAFRSYVWYAAAASIALAVTVGLGIFVYNSADPDPTHISAQGKLYDYLLPDGSAVSLNAGSKLEIAGSYKSQRQLVLEGEGYFEVQPDKTNPFTVHFDGHKLVVLGTKFNVRNLADESNKEITVTEGLVLVYPEGSSQGIEVRKDQQLLLSENVAPAVHEVDAEYYISWKTGNLDFKRARLVEVATVLSRHFDKQISIAPEISDCRFTGDLKELNLDDAIQVLAKSSFLEIEQNENNIYLTGPACEQMDTTGL